MCNLKKKADVIRDSLSTNIRLLSFSNTPISRKDINNFLHISTILKDILKLVFKSWKVF